MTRKKKKSAGSGSRGAREQLPPELFSALRDIFEWARNQDIPATLVGGAAVCLHGAVRATDDIDLLVLTTRHPAEILESLVARGYLPRHSDPVEFAQVARVLLMTHASSGVAVDVMLGMCHSTKHVLNAVSRNRPVLELCESRLRKPCV